MLLHRSSSKQSDTEFHLLPSNSLPDYPKKPACYKQCAVGLLTKSADPLAEAGAGRHARKGDLVGFQQYGFRRLVALVQVERDKTVSTTGNSKARLSSRGLSTNFDAPGRPAKSLRGWWRDWRLRCRHVLRHIHRHLATKRRRSRRCAFA